MLLRSVLAFPGLDSSLLELKVLIPLWTRTPSQFRHVPSIFYLNSSGQHTQVTFTLSAYPISPDWLTRILPKQLTRTPPERLTRALLDRINAYPTLYTHIRLNYFTRFFSQSDFYLHGLTRSYPAKLPYQSLPDRTSAYPIVSGHLTQIPYPAGYPSTGLTRTLPHQPPTLT
jgi:hypothetical protein